MLWLLMEVHYSLTSHDTDLPVIPYLVGSSSWYGCLVYIYTHILWCDGDHHRAFSFSLWIGEVGIFRGGHRRTKRWWEQTRSAYYGT